MDIKNEVVINKVWAIVSVDSEGREGIIAQQTPVGWTPLVFAHERMISKFLPDVLKASYQSGVPFRILEFSAREDVTEKYKSKID